MKTIKALKQFKKTLKMKKEDATAKFWILLSKIIYSLANDEIIDPKYQDDHRLIGNWKDFRECHIKPNLILIYRKENDDILQLVRLRSHAELEL